MSSTDSDSKVFRIEKRKSPLMMNVSLPIIHTETPKVETFSWTDYSPVAALKLATEDKKSCSISAPPGCGKTFW